MDIIAVIPLLPPGRPSVAEQTQLVNSFLRLRLALRSHFTWGVSITLTVTSMFPMEGKTFVAANLCLNFAEAGFRTLFVDGDHRHAGSSAVFGTPSTPGLLDFRIGKTRLNEVVNGRRRVTPDTALRLAQVTGMSAVFWLGLQQDWDSWHALRATDAVEIGRLTPLPRTG